MTYDQVKLRLETLLATKGEVIEVMRPAYWQDNTKHCEPKHEQTTISRFCTVCGAVVIIDHETENIDMEKLQEIADTIYTGIVQYKGWHPKDVRNG